MLLLGKQVRPAGQTVERINIVLNQVVGCHWLLLTLLVGVSR